MILNFVFSNFNAIFLFTWIIFLIVVGVRYFKPTWLNNFSYFKLLCIALSLNIFFVLFLSWGQYYVWSQSSDVTRALLSLPLPKQVPFPSMLEWLRPLFEGNHGYFAFYVLGRFWMNIFILFSLSTILYFIFKAWNFYRGGFQDDGPIMIFVLMIISNFPGLLVNLSLGFIISILFLIYSNIRGVKNIKIEPIFIFTTLISLLFTKIIVFYML